MPYRVPSIEPTGQEDAAREHRGQLQSEAEPSDSDERILKRAQPPVDIKLLSQAVIELNILRKNAILYPPSHVVLTSSLERAWNSLIKMNELWPKLTIGAANDCLLVGQDLLDPKNPVNREFAIALNQRSISSLTFLQGLERKDIEGFTNILTLSPEKIRSLGGAARILAENGVTGVQVQIIDYSAFHLTEEQEVAREKSQKDLQSTSDIWRDFVRNLMSGQISTDGRGWAPGDHSGADPVEIANFFNQAKLDVKHGIETYETFIVKHLRSTAGPQPVNCFNSLLENLDPQLRRQFLSVTFDLVSEGEIDPLFEEDIIVEMLKIASDEGREISPTLLALVHKLSQVGEESSKASSTERAHHLPAGIEASRYGPHLESLFDREDRERYVDGPYQSMLDEFQGRDSPSVRTQEAQGRRPSSNKGQRRVEWEDASIIDKWVNSLEQGFLESRAASMLLALMEKDTETEVYRDYCKHLIASIPPLLEIRESGLLVEILNTFKRHSLDKPQGIMEIAGQYLQTFYSQRFIVNAVRALLGGPEPDAGKAAPFISALGPVCIRDLLGLYERDDSPGHEQALKGLLLGFGAPALEAVYERLRDPRAKIVKLLKLIGDGGRDSIPLLRPLVEHGDLSVRMGAVAVLLGFKDPAGIHGLRKALQSKIAAESMQAIALAGAYRVSDVAEELLRLIKMRSFRQLHWEVNEAIIEALGQIGHPRAIPVLEKIMRIPGGLFGKKLRRMKLLLFLSLENYPSSLLGGLIAAGQKSNDRVVRLIAKRLSSEAVRHSQGCANNKERPI